MNANHLNAAMQYIDDQYLDIADAPQKEIIQMSKTKTITRIFLIAAVIAMLTVTAYAADFLHVKSLFSGSRTSYEAFPEMEQAMEDAGFRMNVKETFRSGYTFEEVNVREVRGEDESDLEVLTFSAIAVIYRDAARNLLILNAEPEIPEIDAEDRPAAQSRKIGKVTVDYFVDYYKFVPEDYEPTEEEKEWMQEPGNYISYGSDEVEEQTFSFLVWSRDGIHYSIMDPRGAEQSEVMFAMAEELILAK